MNYYIINDDPSITMILADIIEDDFANTVSKTCNSSVEAFKDLLIWDVDIVLIDLLMPNLDGVSLVKQIHKQRPQLKFIMISQVKDEGLRQNAYRAGIEFFISKPINLVEVKTVLKKVAQSVEMERKLSTIQQLLAFNSSDKTPVKADNPYLTKAQAILNYLSISSESGYADILRICQLMVQKNITFEHLNLQQELGIDSHEQKVMMQRVRRTVKKAMVNMAHLCIDDFDNAITLQYANHLFGYQNIHKEIQAIQKDRLSGGKVSLRKFFDALTIECHD